MTGLFILDNPFPPGREISAIVIWGKILKRGKGKEENMK
jgi:hypothetical protein